MRDHDVYPIISTRFEPAEGKRKARIVARVNSPSFGRRQATTTFGSNPVRLQDVHRLAAAQLARRLGYGGVMRTDAPRGYLGADAIWWLGLD